MPQANNIRQLCEATREKLKQAADKLETFLNEHSLPELMEGQDEDRALFYQGFMSDLRHLLVFSEVCYEKLGVTLRRGTFDEEAAEKVLYHVYHDCVNNFFYPKNESYSEDGRYAYTGQDAIRFRKKPVRAARDIVLDITGVFEELRDDLTYYESDYLTQLRLRRSAQ
ncbi:YpuI family protein [Paenibacillus phocaensis]|uniref:YpuI family protein n=1 Tax=Paenibacillus phocaensis TaxID=1776378 RepID=UPI0003AB1979|nr:YpuI family protein [Paenibacillus phocaensis]